MDIGAPNDYDERSKVLLSIDNQTKKVKIARPYQDDEIFQVKERRQQMEQEKKFVEIEVSRKMIDMDHPVHNEKNDKDYVRIIGPEGSNFLYPSHGLHVRKDDENKITFTRPEGTEIQLRYNKRVDGVPDDAPNNEKWETVTKTVTIEDLKEMYAADRQAFRDQMQGQNEEASKYVNMTVPSDWGYKFPSKDGKEMVSVSISIRRDNENTYWSFVMPADRFKESTKEEGMSYFGFPRKNPEGNDFMIHLKSSVKQENGEYKDVFMDVTSEDLKKYVDDAKERSAAKDRFISVDVSEKLIRPFTSSSGTELVAVAVPVYLNETDEKARFYEIVVPASRVKDSGRDGMQTVSLFRKNPDGASYMHVARFSEKNMETGEYEEQQMQLSSEEVVERFKISAERYRESQQSEHTIADELNQGKTVNALDQEEQAVRHHGR